MTLKNTNQRRVQIKNLKPGDVVSAFDGPSPTVEITKVVRAPIIEGGAWQVLTANGSAGVYGGAEEVEIVDHTEERTD